MFTVLVSLLLCARMGAPALAADHKAELGVTALTTLRMAMSNEDPDVRALAVQQWGELGNRAVVPQLQAALKDPSRYVRIAAAGSLHALGDDAGIPTLDEIIRERAPKPKGGKGIIVNAAEELRSIARNKIRVAAIRTLARFGSGASVKTFAAAKNDPDGSVRDAAAAALARNGSEEDMDRFIQALASEDAGERLSAVRGLGDIARPAVVESLKRLSKDPDKQVRAAVMAALGAAGDSSALTELADGIQDADDLVRSNAVRGMSRLASPEAVPYLKVAYEKAANVYMKLLADQGLARLKTNPDLGLAQRSLSQPDVDTRMLAVETLEAAGGDQAVDLLEIASGDSSARVRVRAAAALIKLLKKG